MHNVGTNIFKHPCGTPAAPRRADTHANGNVWPNVLSTRRYGVGRRFISCEPSLEPGGGLNYSLLGVGTNLKLTNLKLT